MIIPHEDNRQIRSDACQFQVRKFVIRREIPSKREGCKPNSKAPKIQRLITPERLQRKRRIIMVRRRRAEASKEAAVRTLQSPESAHEY